MRLSVQSGRVPGPGAENGGQTVLESQIILLNFAFVKFNFIYLQGKCWDVGELHEDNEMRLRT